MAKKKRPTPKGRTAAKSSRRAELRRERELEAKRLARKRSRAAKKGWETRRKRTEAVQANITKATGYKFKPRPQGKLDKSAQKRVREQQRFLNSLKHKRLSRAQLIEVIREYLIENDILGDELEWVDLSEYRKKK